MIVQYGSTGEHEEHGNGEVAYDLYQDSGSPQIVFDEFVNPSIAMHTDNTKACDYI